MSFTSATCIIFSALFIYNVNGQSFNPSILQDSRDLPKTDGRFGFLYRTEDGIAHAAKSEGDGVVHGRYTYSDPSGFKLNFNYNAGSKATPGYNYDDQPSAPVYNRPVQQNNNYAASRSNNNYDDAQAQNLQIRRTRPPTAGRNNLNDGNDYSSY